MSKYNVTNLPRITPDKLATLIRSQTPGISIIDVRDSDFVGGHIVGCQNVPVHTHDWRMPELVRTLRDQDTVVFHCALSQQRGPSSALAYLRARERMAGKGEVGLRADGEDVEAVQKVVVLEGGFTKWAQK
jgi:rhodanese-related sulfurtransferase